MSGQQLQPLVDLGEGGRDLLLPHGMRRRLGLTLELGAREAQRLELADAFGIYRRLPGSAPPTLGLAFLDLLLDARIRVNQSFSGITHS
jgi:hypothetical protein